MGFFFWFPRRAACTITVPSTINNRHICNLQSIVELQHKNSQSAYGITRSKWVRFWIERDTKITLTWEKKANEFLSHNYTPKNITQPLFQTPYKIFWVLFKLVCVIQRFCTNMKYSDGAEIRRRPCHEVHKICTDTREELHTVNFSETSEAILGFCLSKTCFFSNKKIKI